MNCACGCGQEAGIYKSSFLRIGIVAGELKKYLKGHARKGKRAPTCARGHATTPENTNPAGKCRACARIKGNKSNIKHKETRQVKQRARSKEIRLKTLAHYGGKCACCGVDTYEFLSFDHVKGGGNKHRKEIKCPLDKWLYRNNYPEGFRVLCHNCNFALGAYGYCPHQKETQ